MSAHTDCWSIHTDANQTFWKMTMDMMVGISEVFIDHCLR